MTARVVTLRALVIEDIARTAARAHRPAAALLVRRHPEDCDALCAVAEDLATSTVDAARVASRAAAALAVPEWTDESVSELARFCGLSDAEWTAETAREQGVEVSS